MPDSIVQVGIKYEHVDLDQFKAEDDELLQHYADEQQKMIDIAKATGQSMSSNFGGVTSAAAASASKIADVHAASYARVESSAAASNARRVQNHAQADARITAQHRTSEEMRRSATETTAVVSKRYGDLEVQAHALKTERLKEQYRDLVRESRILQGSIREATDARAKAELQTEKRLLDEKKAIWRQELTARDEVVHHGQGASLGILGIGRETIGEIPGIGKLAEFTKVGAVVGFVTESFKKMYEATDRAEQASDQLYISLSRSHMPVENLEREYERAMASSKEAAYSFAMDHNEVIRVTADIASLTGLVGPQLDKVRDISIALGKSLNMNAEEVARMFAKATDPQNEQAAARLGLHLDKNMSTQERINEVMNKYGSEIDAVKAKANEGVHPFERLSDAVQQSVEKFSAPVFKEITPLIEKIIPHVAELGDEFGHYLVPFIHSTVQELTWLGQHISAVGDAMISVARWKAEIDDFVHHALGTDYGISETKTFDQALNTAKALKSLNAFDLKNQPTNNEIRNIKGGVDLGEVPYVPDMINDIQPAKQHMAAMKEIVVDAYSKLTKDYIDHIKDIRDLRIISDNEEIQSLRAKAAVVNAEEEANIQKRIDAEMKNYAERVRVAKENGEKITALLKERNDHIKQIEDSAYVDRIRAAADLERAIEEIEKRQKDEADKSADEDLKAAQDQDKRATEQQVAAIQERAARLGLSERAYNREIMQVRLDGAKAELTDAITLGRGISEATKAVNDAQRELDLFNYKQNRQDLKDHEQMEDDLRRRHIEATNTSVADGFTKEYQLEQLKYDQEIRLLQDKLKTEAILRDEYNERMRQAEEDHTAAVIAIQQREVDERLGLTQAFGAAYQTAMKPVFETIDQEFNTQHNIAGAFFGSMLKTVLDFGEKVLAEQAVKFAASQIFQTASTAASVASMNSIAAAAAPAAAMVSIATFGAADAAALAGLTAVSGAAESLTSFGAIARMADGGIVRGPGGPKDDRIAAMLSNGEGVLNADAVKRLTPEFVHAANKGKIGHFAGGVAVLGGGFSGDDGVTYTTQVQENTAQQEEYNRRQARRRHGPTPAESEQENAYYNQRLADQSVNRSALEGAIKSVIDPLSDGLHDFFKSHNDDIHNAAMQVASPVAGVGYGYAKAMTGPITATSDLVFGTHTQEAMDLAQKQLIQQGMNPTTFGVGKLVGEGAATVQNGMMMGTVLNEASPSIASLEEMGNFGKIIHGSITGGSTTAVQSLGELANGDFTGFAKHVGFGGLAGAAEGVAGIAKEAYEASKVSKLINPSFISVAAEDALNAGADLFGSEASPALASAAVPKPKEQQKQHQELAKAAVDSTKELTTLGKSIASLAGETPKLSAGLSKTGSTVKTLVSGFASFIPGGDIAVSVLDGLGSVFGFADGDYTGDGAPHRVAGFAHKGEFYFSARDTARFGVSSLRALRAGDPGPIVRSMGLPSVSLMDATPGQRSGASTQHTEAVVNSIREMHAEVVSAVRSIRLQQDDPYFGNQRTASVRAGSTWAS